MMTTLRYLYVVFSLISCTSADGWDDFTNNLATDLAPLIELFGDQVTKQFLSESISLLDDIIFALAPLGILTAVVSAIRVCGNPSLRAFIGRAQEDPGSAELELLSCVSETTAEIFSDGGIARVFGRPKVLEVVACSDDRDDPAEVSLKPLSEVVKSNKGPDDHLPLIDVPNLSLNKGIKRRNRVWFYLAACVGCGLQIGVMIFAALTVFLWPSTFKKDGSAVASYAFPLFIIGTTLLTAGMFSCALLIEQSSRKYFFPLNSHCKVYWLQPGNQKVGDQVFEAFAGVLQGKDDHTVEYVRSVRCCEQSHGGSKDIPLLVSVSLTMLGFVFQFVGLRGLHSSVTLAQLGSTLVMAIVRTSLRTQRMERKDNLLLQEQDLLAHDRQELDWFAFHLHGVRSFHVSPGFGDSDSQTMPSDGMTRKVLHTRVRLAELTTPDWDDIPIRIVAHNLARTIEATIGLIYSWSNIEPRDHKFSIFVECQFDKTTFPYRGEYTITVQSQKYHSGWKVNAFELEAVLGLWIWSLLRSNPELELWSAKEKHLVRLLERDSNNQSVDHIVRYYHKWIYRQTRPEIVPSDRILRIGGTFGCDLSKPFDAAAADQQTLVMRTENGLNVLAAQDIYIHFLHSELAAAAATLKDLGGDTDILPSTTTTTSSSQTTFVASNTRIEELATFFETNHLGSREDALACIVPVLRRRNLLPELAADSPAVREKVEKCVQAEQWGKAFAMIQWLCERSEGAEFENSVLEFGYLCCRGMMDPSPEVRSLALERIEIVMQQQNNLHNGYLSEFAEMRQTPDSTRSSFWQRFTQELGWLAWQIAKHHSDRSAQERLEGYGITHDALTTGEVDYDHDHDEQLAQDGKAALVELWFALSNTNHNNNNDYVAGELDSEGNDILRIYTQRALDWAVQNSYDALLQWLLIKFTTSVMTKNTDFLHDLLVYAATHRYHRAISILKRNGLNLDSRNSRGETALIDAANRGEMSAVQELLDSGAAVDGRADNDATALTAAIVADHVAIARFLLQHGAGIDKQDYRGRTALMWAALKNRVDCARFLLSHGADVDMRCSDGSTALLLAAAEDHTEMVQMLVSEGGADIDAQDEIGWTALMVAVRRRNLQLLQMLLERQADVHKRNVDDATALTLARDMCWEEACNILLEKTAAAQHNTVENRERGLI
ncbi:hypothetical protein VTN77DRAFT_2102 [Rasamsonia byssochlamydoides]|uniref:uncharacterized protein n=1 Tax=Rasamsonia byssochlamydoides TaxID=89139 RepID=UPI0037449EAD